METKQLAEIVDIRRGSSPRPIQDYLATEGLPWVRIADATSVQGRYITKTKEYVKPEGKCNTVEVTPGTLILSNSATPGLPKIMGITAYVHDGWLVFSNYRGVIRDYLYYFFLNKRRELVNQANGSVFKNLKIDIVKEFDILLPSIETQQRIVSLLGGIDSMLEVSQRTNDYLAAICDTVFSDRFGDIEGNAVLSDIAEITMGQSPSGKSYNEEGNGTVFYQGRGEFGWRFPTQRLFTTEPKRMALKGDVLMSVRAPVGDLNVAYEDCCIGRGLAAIHSQYPSYCLYLMRSLGRKLDAYNGEGTVFGSINGKALKGLEIGLPDADSIEAFEAFSRPIDQQIRANVSEERSLASLRDALLPKLMTGEIDVSKAELPKLPNNHLIAG